jgi:hypothetical protein
MTTDRYPYEDGGFVVIGPECFAAEDGSVLSWRGENYEPQPEVERLRAALVRAREAIRLSQEYVGDDLLPPIEGWEWFDALREIDAALAIERPPASTATGGTGSSERERDEAGDRP